VFINDGRDVNEISTYLADRGQIVENEAGIFLVLESGSIHRRGSDKAASTSVVEFQRYAFDLSSLAPSAKGDLIRPMERSFAYVLEP
ncbi:LptF/LptG family permease, partial [Klebsiella pneumoniae]|nr:LptF/LptG family permease [Klebsiella pneumoniae]